MVTVTLSPAAAPVAVPLMMCAWLCSARLMTSSPATVLMVTAGTVTSTVRLRSADAGLPALSLTLAVTVTLPSPSDARSAAGTFSVQLPSAPAVVV